MFNHITRGDIHLFLIYFSLSMSLGGIFSTTGEVQHVFKELFFISAVFAFASFLLWLSDGEND